MKTNEPDWTLPGMENFSEYEKYLFKRSIKDGDIVNSIASLGWALWPTENKGYYNSYWLRRIADFLEIQNKPFWDAYDQWCEEQERNNPVDDDEYGILFSDGEVGGTEGGSV